MIEKAAEDTKDSGTIRVWLKLDDNIKVYLQNHIIVENDLTKEVIEYKRNVKSINIDLTTDSIFLDGMLLDFPLNIYSIDDKLIKINNKKFFGYIKIDPSSDSKIINYVPLETYLMSVIPSEVPLSFDVEAIKAQAIVARTYAYRFIKRNSKRYDYDVDNTTRYQVYNGYTFFMNPYIVKKLKNAVNETKGKIVIYEDEPILAYFHSNSGGKIRSGGEYFGTHSDLPYLISQDDPFSLDYPGDKWECKISFDDFKKTLNCDVDLTNDQFIYDNNGFIEKITISEDSYYPKDIRRSIGYKLIRSERFSAEILPDEKKIKFNGIGFGHGVGMSQWGAQGMADRGFDYNQIISFYFPHTSIINIINENKDF
jgi:stage II sporulation protein D